VHYTPNAGLPALRRAIADKLVRDNGIRVDPEREVLVTVGAKEAVFISLYAFLEPGDEVLVPTPIWPDYLTTVRVVGGAPVPIPTRLETAYQVDPAAVEAAVTPRTKMLVVHSPTNPTGAVLDRATLAALAEIAIRHDLLVISDEIYEKLIYDGAEHVSIGSLPGMAERTLTLNGFSKAYSMTGWRLGYVAGPAPLLASLLKAHQIATTCATSFAQWGGVTAYREDQACVAEMVREFDRRRRLVVGALHEMPGVRLAAPRGAFYVFPDFRAFGLPDMDLAEYLLKEARLATVPGSEFGEPGHLRLSYAAPYEAIAEGMARMATALAALKDRRG
jgi:aspartate/methionine/tyrosine aminotransferase